MAIMDAGISCWDAKYYYHYPRPIQAIPGFKTILGTPNFPAYTSGHSTFSAAGAEVLSYIFPEEAQQCQTWAREAAESRKKLESLRSGIAARAKTRYAERKRQR
jgi:membrane-associated phospholipid phosphatase